MKKNITPYNDNGQANGFWKQYYSNGKRFYQCVFINGKRNGFGEYYWNYDGKVTAKIYHL